jgi:hypothetical protein
VRQPPVVESEFCPDDTVVLLAVGPPADLVGLPANAFSPNTIRVHGRTVVGKDIVEKDVAR